MAIPMNAEHNLASDKKYNQVLHFFLLKVFIVKLKVKSPNRS